MRSIFIGLTPLKGTASVATYFSITRCFFVWVLIHCLAGIDFRAGVENPQRNTVNTRDAVERIKQKTDAMKWCVSFRPVKCSMWCLRCYLYFASFELQPMTSRWSLMFHPYRCLTHSGWLSMGSSCLLTQESFWWPTGLPQYHWCSGSITLRVMVF